MTVAGPPSRPTVIGPAAYVAWRASALGRVTETLEERLILEDLGELTGARVLDAGCGDGALTAVLAARGARVVGLDADPAMLGAARARIAAAGLDAAFVRGRIERLPFADASFDTLVAITVLCFVGDAPAAIREMGRVLRPGGRLVLGELGRASTWAALRRLRGWLGAATWKRAHFRSARELRRFAAAAGLEPHAVRGAVFYPPLGAAARVLAPFDPWLGRRTTWGAGFIVLSARKPSSPSSYPASSAL